MSRPMTHAMESALNSLTAMDRKVLLKVFAESPRSSTFAKVLRGVVAEIRQLEMREADVLAALTGDHMAEIDAMEKAAGIPDFPPATGVAMVFDPDTGEFRRVD